MWGRRREQRLCSPRLGGERSSGILEANSGLESITAGAVPALGVMDAPQAPSLVSILPFLLMGAASRGEGEPQQREGQHSTLIPRSLLAGIIPIASALGADALGWDQQLFHSWGSFNLCQSWGEQWQGIPVTVGGGLEDWTLLKGILVSLPNLRLGIASSPPAPAFELIHRAFQRFPGVLGPPEVGLSVGREENFTVRSPPGLCDTEDAGGRTVTTV